MTDNEMLDNKVALVTGASRGIGRGIALRLARMGVNVVVNYRSSEELAKNVVREIEISGGEAIAIQADVSKSDDIKRMMAEIRNSLGEIDILVNNAAIGQVKSYENITETDWDETINVNLKSVFLMTQEVIPYMLNTKWGRIINISSVAAFTGGLVGPHYTASKAGINGLTRYYASRLVKSGITVNAIAPALIETEMVKKAKLEPSVLPIGRFGKLDEIASVVEMMVTNGFMTGQVVSVDGGLHFR